MQPTERDLEVLHEWWGRTAPDITPDVKGLWFGITELVHGGELRTLYVAGFPTFDPADLSRDWATDYCWWPSDRYVTLVDFAMLPDKPFQDVLEYVAGLIRSLDPSRISNVEGAAVGFDDGDFVIL